MPAPRLTTDEYLRGPETVLPQELIYGIVRDAPAPTPGHQAAVGGMFLAVSSHVRDHTLGRVWLSPIDVVLDRGSNLVVQPDLVFVSYARLGMVTDRVWGAPDLVIEVLSPRPRIGSLEERVGWFAQHGVRECWLYRHLPCEVEVLQFAGGAIAKRQTFAADEPIRSAVLPRFEVAARDIL